MDVNGNPALIVWMILSIPASGLSFFLTYPNPISMFHLFYAIMNISALIVVLIGWLDDLTEASTDWEEEETASSISTWSLIGVSVVLVTAFFLGFFLSNFSVNRTTQIAFFWVPHELYPLKIAEVGTILPLMMNLFGTCFSVVPGEEGMKITSSAVYKGYEHTDLQVPFALHPACLLGNGLWSAMHVIKGQYPLPFGITVFGSGIVMDFVSAQSSSILTRYFIHFLFNSLIIITNFILAGALTIKVI